MEFLHKKVILLFVVVFCFSGCSTLHGAKSNRYAASWIPENGKRKVYILPFSRVYRFDSEFIPIIREVLLQELGNLGHTALPKNLSIEEDGRIILQQFNEISGDEFVYPRDFYESIMNKVPGMDIYLFPSVVSRTADLEGKVAKWDGTSHTFVMKGGSGIGHWSGQQNVYSIRIEAFDSNGSWLLTSYGGISLPKYAYMPTRELREKEDLFGERSDYKALVRGVQKAIQPMTIADTK